MFASRAFAIDVVSGLIRIPSGRDGLPEGPVMHPVLRSLVPAIETTFGIEHESLFPDEIQALVEALRAGCEPLPIDRCREPDADHHSQRTAVG